jgi:hypothetical protein
MPNQLLMCPFCRTTLSSFPPQTCSGKFTDTDHPSGVAPVAVVVDDDGNLDADSEQQLADARATYST